MFNIKAFLNLTYYTSPLDQFLAKFDHEHSTPSTSQQREINKYNRIHHLRDSQEASEVDTSFWDNF